MPDIYVKNNAATPTSPYNSWNTAATLLTTASGIDTAGDTIYISSTHSEATSTNQTVALAGTVANPVRVLSVTEDATPVLTAGATIATTGAISITTQGSAYFFGLTFNLGSGSGSFSSMTLANSDGSNQVFDSCAITFVNTSASNRINIGSNSTNIEGSITLKDVTVKFANTAQGFLVNGNGKLTMAGGGIDNTSSQLTSGFILSAAQQQDASFIGVDLSRLATTCNLVGATAQQCVGKITFINCKLPASWTGQPAVTPTNTNMRVSLYNCDSGAANYRVWIVTSAGSIREETTIVKTGGASDGTTSLSWNMTTVAATNELINPLISDTIAVWLESIGTSQTITIDIIHDSTVALTDAEVWLEIDYLGSSTNPLSSELSDKRATILTTATNQAASTESWTTTGLTNPNKQKLEVTFTPQMKGFVYARVFLAKPSYTIYVDYEPTVT